MGTGIAHQSIEKILSQIQLNARALTLYRKILENMFEKDGLVRKEEIKRTENEFDKINKRITILQNQLLDGNILPQDYQTMKQRIEKELKGLELKLKELKQDKSPYKVYVSQTIPMLENLVDFYRKSNGKTKKKILGCIFSEKLVLEKGKVATYEFTIPILVLLNATKVLGRSTKKKEIENDLLSCWAPLTIESCNHFTSYMVSYFS